jgi:hypothetical protein
MTDDDEEEKKAVMTREELKRRIEIADRVLRETPRGKYPKDELWLECERARLEDELRAIEASEKGPEAAR